MDHFQPGGSYNDAGSSAAASGSESGRGTGNGDASSLPTQQNSSIGPIRKNTGKSNNGHGHAASGSSGSHRSDEGAAASPVQDADGADGDGKGTGPVKAACLFCRSRKSKCDGEKPCKACIARKAPHDCLYTASRRGGKPKKKQPETSLVQNHLQSLFGLTNLPHTVRVPGAVPQLREFQQEDMSLAGPAASGGNGFAYFNPFLLPSMAAQGVPQAGPSQAAAQTAPNMVGLPVALGANTFQQPTAGPSSIAGGIGGQDASMLGGAPPAAGSNGALPSAPQAYSAHAQPPSAHVPEALSPTSPAFSSSASLQPSIEEASVRHGLLVDYYRYLYRFIPVLLPPEHLPTLAASFSERSPFLLALQCILPLLKDEEQPPGPLHGLGGSALNFGSPEKKKRVRQITAVYQRMANEAIESVLEAADEQESPAALLEVIQALCVLIIYEYGSGRALKARLKADQALGLAMSKGLHRLSSQSPAGTAQPSRQRSSTHSAAPMTTDFSKFSAENVHEMMKRTWWVTWSLLMWASYNTGRIPTIRADDQRVTSDLPKCKDQQAWIGNVLSLQALLLVQDRVLALAQSTDDPEGQTGSATTWASPPSGSSGRLAELGRSYGFGSVPTGTNPSESGIAANSAQGATPSTFSDFPSVTESSRSQIVQSMKNVDQSLQQQISSMEAGRMPTWRSQPPTADLSGIEDDMIAYLHLSTAIQLYTAWLTLHLSSAFQGASLFERKLCFLSTVGEDSNKQVCQVPIPDAFSEIFPSQTSANALPPAGNDTDWLNEIFPAAGSFGQVSEWTYSGPDKPQSSVTSPQEVQEQQRKANAQAAALKGPFEARYSLDRCVYASKRLLELSRGDALKVNPFPACSHVLIAFTLLMQALSLSDAVNTDDDHDDEDEDSKMRGAGDAEPHARDITRELVQSAHGSAALQQNPPQTGEGRQQRLTQLHEIWEKVKEARDTLAELSKYWDLVIPMADEVNLCLTTSQLLFDAQQ